MNSTTAQRTYEVRTYGCQMNERDSDAVSAMLRARGYHLYRLVDLHPNAATAQGLSIPGLGVQGGALLSLATGTISVLGHEREQRTVLRWNVPNDSL
jgi:hypothetical protein